MRDLDRILSILQEVRRRVVRIGIVLASIFGFLLFFELKPFRLSILGTSVPFAYPWPNPFYNVAAQLFIVMRDWMLPANVELLNVGVGDSILAQMEIGILVALILSMPWIVHEVGAFLVPALRKNERLLLRQIGIPATALFAVGTTIGLVWLTPFTFRLLFFYVAADGLAPVLGVQDFILFALLYSLAFGVVFELPVFIYALTRLGVVKAAAWRKHWRGAVLGALVFGMIVTPDNSGITMLIIATPMIALYFGGAFFAGRWEKRSAAPPSPPRLATGTG
ncbi:MAG: twin-arginine translocase subunit TatC [Thermoplasmata archaeon]